MATVSADPTRLGGFVDGVAASRTAVQWEQGSLLGFMAGVQLGCPGRAVHCPALGALGDVLSNMAGNETFVSVVRSALEAADTVDGDGVVTVDASVVSAAFVAAGVAEGPPVPVEFDAATREITPPTSGMVDDPICASNGNMVHHDDDIAFPAIAAALNVTRTWNSLLADRPGAFGDGWSSVFDVHLDVAADKVVATTADGNVVAFVPWRGGWAAPGVPRLRLQRVENEGVDCWVLQTDHVRRFRFDGSGALTGWDVGVAGVSVARDEFGRIVRLDEAVTGRSLEVRWLASGLVAALVSDDGRTVRYERDADERIVRAVSTAGSVSYVWDGPLLVSVVDADGVAAFANVYDDEAKVVSQTSPFGRESTYTYDGAGLTVFSDAAGVVQAMRHDRFGNLVAIVDVDGSAMRLAYNADRKVTQVVERDGAAWRYSYDGDDLVERVDPDGLSQRWTWDERHRLVTDTDRAGAVTRFEYDTEHMAPSRVIGPDGAVVSQLLDERGLPVEIVDADGVITRLRWDSDGQLAETSDAFGAATTFDYVGHGLLARIAPATGAATVMTLDDRGRIVRTERGSAVWEYRYTPAGRVCGGVEPGDVGWSATFGEHGAVASLTDAAGSTVWFGYDQIGNVTSTTAPDGAVYRNVYDEVGKLVASVEPNGATTAKRYDRRGQAVEVTDARGNVWRRRLDVLGRTVSSTAPDGATTSWTYHPEGHVASVTGPDGRVWRTEHDTAGRPVARIAPGGGRATIEYTPAGRVRSRTSPAGRRETFEYDAAGRLAVVVGVDGVRRELIRDERGLVTAAVEVGADGSAPRRVDYGWDDDHQLTAVTEGAVDGDLVSRIARDSAGRVVESVDASGVTRRFDWDERGLLAAATDPAGLATRYSYDARGRLAAIDAPGGRTTAFGYGGDGRLATLTDPAGTVTGFARDAVGAVTGMRHGDGSGWQRRLDACGRELERVGVDGSVAGRYDYDSAGRLASATVPETGIAVEFLWDDDDRIVEVTGAEGTRRIEHDADGWVTATVDPDGVRTVYRRDARGRVIGADAGDGDATAAFGGPAGDAAHRDVAVRDRAGRLTIGGDGTVYRYDDAGRIAEIAPLDDVPTTFAYSPDGLLASERGPAGHREYRYDAAGRVIAVTADGAVTEISYDACGRRAGEDHPDGRTTIYHWDTFDRLELIERRDALGVTVGEIPIGYDALDRPVVIDGLTVGYHPVTGLPEAEPWQRGDRRPLGGVPAGDVWIVGARVLDPATHQFLSRDPLLPVPARNGAASAYTYAWHDPINWADPTGMRPLSIEEFNEVMSQAEQTTFGRAWEAIKEDPWGTLAMGAVVVTGAVLCATPLAPVGVGILVGAGASAGIGLATGTFNPRMVAVNGIVGGASAGIGSAVTTTSWQGAVAVGMATGAGETIAGSYLMGQGFPSTTELLVGTGTGGAASGAGHAWTSLHPPGATAALDHAPTGAAAPTPGNAIEPLWAQAPYDGFLGNFRAPEVLQPGTLIDRYGSEYGRFFSPAGTPFEARALPGEAGTLSTYEVIRPMPVEGGIVAPAFGQPGLGIQYMSSEPTVQLIEDGVLKRADGPQ